MSGGHLRGLTVFISDLRNCTSKEQEAKRVEKEMAHIRQKFTADAHMNGYNRKKYVWKILYMYMLGYEVDFGHMEAVNLISSPKYSEKSVGYAWCALMLREGDELLRLIINSIRTDLISKQDNAVCLALNSICNVGGKEFAEALSNDVLKLLTANLTKSYVRKKSALTTLRLYRKSADALPAAEWADKILSLLDEKNIGVLTSITSLILGVVSASGPAGWENAAPKAARTLTRLVLNKDYSNDYLYYGIPTPWLQVKLLRMLQFFPAPEEHALKMRVTEVLQRIVSGTDVTKNVNKNNATHAVLFEAINLVIHLGSSTELLGQAVTLLGRFISIREANIRYLGLDTMARLSHQQPETLEALKKHQSTILFSLKDPDISIRRRALDLVYSMCDSSTVKETVSELLNYLAGSDLSIREELVLKIAILAERFATDQQWYVDVVLQLIKSAGDNVSEEIWYRVVQIITNQGEDLQKYATETVWRALQSDPLPHRTLVKVAGYVLGEFGHMIADVPGSGAVQQLELLHAQFAQGAPDTRALLLNTYVKLAHTYQEILPQVDAVLRAQSAAMDQELQQRATEYLALSDAHLGTIKSSVLEMMPPFTERESVVQKQLAKSQGEPGAPQVDRSAPEGGAVVRDDKLPPQPESAPSDLIGGLDLDAQPAAPAPASIDLLGETMASTPAPPPAAPAATAADDLLGLMSDIPTPTAQGASQATAHNGAGDLLDGLSSLTSPNPTQHATPPAADDVARWTALCLRDNGVLHEDAAIQVGVKMEFRGHQGRLAVYLGNKTVAALTAISTEVSPCSALALDSSAVTSTVQPGAQTQQLFNVECTAFYGEAPQLSLQFAAAGGSVQHVRLQLPLVPTKFLQPLEATGPEFFRRWKLLDGKELQQIFKLPATPLADKKVEEVLCAGLHFALLKGVDAATNYVASGWLATKGVAPQSDAASVLLRLEINAQAGMCRFSARSDSADLNALLHRLVVGQLGA